MASEIPGDFFKPYFGLVDQTTYAPVGRLGPWKMTRTTLDPEADGVPTPNNAVPGFKSGFSAKRGATGKVEQASFDFLFTPFVANPLGLFFREGLCLRALMAPDTSTAGPLGLGDFIGTPILGGAGDLIAAVPNSIGYIFLAIRITKIHHMADCAAGQPFDFDFETVHPYAVPGEPLNEITAYGYSATVGLGGFF